MIPRVVNIKTKPAQPYDLYIGRANKWLGLPASRWANPFVLKSEADREKVIAQYEAYVRSSPELLAALPELAGKVLGCYCKPKACHGDVLAKLFLEQSAGDEFRREHGDMCCMDAGKLLFPGLAEQEIDDILYKFTCFGLITQRVCAATVQRAANEQLLKLSRLPRSEWGSQ